MTRKRRHYGVSFSLRRLLGLSALKGRVSKAIDVPLTEQGRERKVGQWVLRLLGLHRPKRQRQGRRDARHVRFGGE